MPNKTNVLIISYFFAPDRRVGALRTSYWYRELPRDKYSVQVITANTEAQGEGVFIVPQRTNPGKFNPIKDAGVTWKKEVRSFVERQRLEVDVVIISGSPFMHFGLTKWLKKTLNCKVVLDYRDPFAINPGFKSSKMKVLIKQFYEIRFNKHADALVTVNSYCAEIITNFYKKPHAIIQNGFDETIRPTLKPIQLKSPVLSYTGKFYFNPKHLTDALEKTKLRLHYAGADGDQIAESTYIIQHGLVAYPDAVNLIANSDVGVIQTYGEDFQSTTKLFDYIRCKRAILIVSNNHLKRGSLHEELKEYPNVFWSRNDVVSILAAINEIQSSTYVEPNDEFCNSFSRKEQMTKLVLLIESLEA